MDQEVVEVEEETETPQITGLKRKPGRPRKDAYLSIPRESHLSEQNPNLVFNKVEALIAALIKDGAKLPLIFLWEQMSFAGNDMEVRIDCAKAIMPYIHRKRVSEIEKNSGMGATVYQQINLTAEKLKDLNDDELRTLAALSAKLALGGNIDGRAGEAPQMEASEVLSG